MGDQLFINDGIVKLRVEQKKDRCLSCVVESGGQISDHKGCNIPKGKLSLNIITEKDKVSLSSPPPNPPPLPADQRSRSSSIIGTAATAGCRQQQKDLGLIAKLDPEYVAASFIGNGDDVEKVRLLSAFSTELESMPGH